MSTAHDSSVLFALDELREHERVRVREQSEQVRMQADLARRQAAEASRRRHESKKNTEDLVRLRRQLALEAEERATLVAQVSHLKVVASRAQPKAPELLPPVLIERSRPYHLLWSVALLCSCLGVFIATYKPSPVERPPMDVAALTPDPQCQPPALRQPSQVPAPVAAAPAPSSPKATPHKPPHSDRKTPASHSDSPHPIAIDEDCDGPLCGLPES